jgi:hypothetical protein
LFLRKKLIIPSKRLPCCKILIRPDVVVVVHGEASPSFSLPSGVVRVADVEKL